MRIANAIFGAVLILFAVVQYNDPDALLWGAIYGLAAFWSGVAALRPGLFASRPLGALLGACLAAGFAGLAWYWPDTPNWWVKEVWWETETAREGMGMMIVVAALCLAAAGAFLRRPGRGAVGPERQ